MRVTGLLSLALAQFWVNGTKHQTS